MNVYKHELKTNYKTALVWIVTLCGIASMIMAFFPMMKAEMDIFVKMMDSFPPVMKAMMGIVVENFNTSIGYYTFAFTYTVLFGAIQAMNLGIGIVSKEERERTADFLLTKPISRVKILTSKLLSALTIFIITNITYSAVSAVFVVSMSDGNFALTELVLINASLFLTQLIFFSIGLSISVLAKKIKTVLPVSLGLVFAFFAISAFAVTSTDDKLRYLTPFQYFKTDYILAQGKYETVYAIIGLSIIIGGIIASYAIYKRRDVHSV